jgi:hypothetical protein
MSRTHAPLALLVALTLALTGCGGVDKRGHKSDAAHSPTAAFASEEEALAAAVDVYDRLTVLGDEIARAGGEGAERLEEVATGEFLAGSVEGFNEYPDRGVHQIGYTTYRDPVLQQYGPGPESAVIIYICEDVSNLMIVDESGTSVVAADRPDSFYLQVTFDLGQDQRLRVASRARWDERAC